MKLTTHLHLVLRIRMAELELYAHSSICFQGVGLNQPSPGITLPYLTWETKPDPLDIHFHRLHTFSSFLKIQHEAITVSLH